MIPNIGKGNPHQGGYVYRYPHPAVTTDCAIFAWDGRELNVLLIERGIEPYKGCWALPGGFLKMDETAEQCAQRELMEETGLLAEVETRGDDSGFGYISQLGAFSGVHRDPRERVITIAYYALVKMRDVRGGDDAADARWVPVNNLPPLAFDHAEIVAAALARIREDMHFRPLAFKLLPEVFTMPQLQALYEQVLGLTFDRRNFAKKMLSLGLLTPAQADNGIDQECMSDSMDNGIMYSLAMPMRSATECREPRVGREPTLYRFDADSYAELKRRGVNRLEF